MNTKHVENKAERKKLKRTARKKAAPKAKRASGVARGANKKKVQKIARASASARRNPIRSIDGQGTRALANARAVPWPFRFGASIFVYFRLALGATWQFTLTHVATIENEEY